MAIVEDDISTNDRNALSSASAGFRAWLQRITPLRDPGPLAEPWRRCLAAGVDTIFLILLCSIIVGVYFIHTTSNNPPESLIPAVNSALTSIWLIVLACWSFGTSPGKWVTGIKIVAAGTQSPPGLSRGVKRVVGYWLASFPMKLGLLPILTHPLRQGWHDRIAGTLVVKRGYEPPETADLKVAETIRRKPGDGFTPPSISYALRGLPLAILLFTFLTVISTWPVAKLGWHHIPGVPGDSEEFAWNNWYVPYCLSHHLDLLHTQLLFYPLNVSVMYSTVDWFTAIVASPILHLYGPVPAYTFVWLLTLVWCQVSSYMLVASVMKSKTAGIVSGPLFGLSPFFMAHGLGHLHMISAEFVPLFALSSYAALSTGKVRHGLLAGFWCGLGALCDLEYIVLNATIIAVLMIAYWWNVKKIDWTKLRQQAIFGLAALSIFSIVSGYFVFPALHSQSTDRYMFRQVQFFSYPVDYITPSTLEWFDRAHEDPKMPAGSVEGVVTPGFVGVIFALLGFCLCKVDRPWKFLGFVALLFSFGEVIQLMPGLGLLAAGLVLGFPGTGFNMPWDFTFLLHSAFLLVATDFSSISQNVVLATPYHWLRIAVPPIQPLRATNRFAIIVLMCVAVMVGAVVKATIEFIATKTKSKWPGVVIPIVLMAAIVAEISSVPYPTVALPNDPALYQVKKLTAGGVHPVLNIPLETSIPVMYEQTIYEQPIFIGLLSRTPKFVMSYIHQNVLLRYCSFGYDENDPKHPSPPATEQNLQQGANQLRKIGVRIVVIHKDQLDQTEQQSLQHVFIDELGGRNVYEDQNYLLYDIDSPNPAS